MCRTAVSVGKVPLSRRWCRVPTWLARFKQVALLSWKRLSCLLIRRRKECVWETATIETTFRKESISCTQQGSTTHDHSKRNCSDMPEYIVSLNEKMTFSDVSIYVWWWDKSSSQFWFGCVCELWNGMRAQTSCTGERKRMAGLTLGNNPW